MSTLGSQPGPEVAVLGAGNGGLALASDLAIKGDPVRLYEHPDLAEAFAPLIAARRIEVENGAGGDVTAAPLALATHDLNAAVNGAPVVHLIVPVFAQERFFEALIPLLEPEQTLVIWAGRFGSLRCRALCAERRPEAEFAVVEVNTLPYGARRTGPISVRIAFRAVVAYCAVAAGEMPATTAAALRARFPEMRLVASPLEAALRNSALPVLGVGPLLNVGAIEKAAGDFALFRDGMTASVRLAIRRTHEEMINVGAAFGFDMAPYEDAVYDGPASVEGANFRDARGGLDGFMLLTGPDQINHRYTVENIRYGLAVVAQLGRLRGVPTPFIDAVCGLADGLCGPEFARLGWRLNDLGLEAAGRWPSALVASAARWSRPHVPT